MEVGGAADKSRAILSKEVCAPLGESVWTGGSCHALKNTLPEDSNGADSDHGKTQQSDIDAQPSRRVETLAGQVADWKAKLETQERLHVMEKQSLYEELQAAYDTKCGIQERSEAHLSLAEERADELKRCGLLMQEREDEVRDLQSNLEDMTGHIQFMKQSVLSRDYELEQKDKQLSSARKELGEQAEQLKELSESCRKLERDVALLNKGNVLEQLMETEACLRRAIEENSQSKKRIDFLEGKVEVYMPNSEEYPPIKKCAAPVRVKLLGKCRGLERDVEFALSRRLRSSIQWTAEDAQVCVFVHDALPRLAADTILGDMAQAGEPQLHAFLSAVNMHF
eukprot:evm.model.scf_621EXC.5 EVM.evm.TU.scf_621EXC.5   scf_621EXC:58450-60003(-)